MHAGRRLERCTQEVKDTHAVGLRSENQTPISGKSVNGSALTPVAERNGWPAPVQDTPSGPGLAAPAVVAIVNVVGFVHALMPMLRDTLLKRADRLTAPGMDVTSIGRSQVKVIRPPSMVMVAERSEGVASASGPEVAKGGRQSTVPPGYAYLNKDTLAGGDGEWQSDCSGRRRRRAGVPVD